MSNPFHSIVGEAANSGPKLFGLAEKLPPECSEGALVGDRTPADQKNAGAVLVPIETGLCEAAEDVKETGRLALPVRKRALLRGGTYGPREALVLINSHFFVGKNGQEIGIFRIKDDGSATFMPPDQFKLAIQNIFVVSGGSAKPAEKYWRENPERRERTIVFKPGAATGHDEYNLWRGFGVEPREGWQKQRRLLRHIWQVICRRDKAKFKYLLRNLAWSVQNPDKHSGVVIVLKSRSQGTGKTTVGDVMLEIFGQHGARIDDKERLLGRFNDFLETTCFALLEEATWAGDPRSADKLKSVITGDTLQVERKFGTCRQVPNRLKAIATTNHDHAVSAGVSDRRNVVFDVSNERVGDRNWFGALHRDLAEGGTGEFLGLLQRLKLGRWHPREIIKTAETAEQQRMSADSVSQWAQACIEADAIVGAGPGSYGTETSFDLGTLVLVQALRDAYTGFCRQHSLRASGPDAFGKACADMFGPRRRLPRKSNPTSNSKRRPWGYHVPNGKVWERKVNARLGT